MVNKKEISIIGGGICGEVAGYFAIQNGHKATLYEASNSLGGLLNSFPTEGDMIEKFYHHSFPSDKNLLALTKELNLHFKLQYYRPRSGYYLEKPHNLSTPINFILFKGLSFFNRIKVGRFLSKVKRISDPSKLDEIPAAEWICKNVGEKSFQDFFYPLLNSKFGVLWEEVSAAWFTSRIQLRANTSLRGELLIYPQGGYSGLINALEFWLEKRGCKIKKNHKLESITLSKDEKAIKSIEILNQTTKEINEVSSDHYLLTIPPSILRKTCPDSRLAKKLKNFPFQGAITVIVALSKSASNIYWLNIKPRKRFGAIIEHTNLIEPKNYGGNIIYYLASYPDHNDEIWEKSDQEIGKLYLEDLKSLFPHLSSEKPKWIQVFRSRNSGPTYKKGYLFCLKKFNWFRDNFSMIGMFRSYPERSVEDSIKQAYEWQQRISL